MKASVLFVLVPAGLTAYGGLIYYRLLWFKVQSKKALLHVEIQLDNHHQTIPDLLLAMSHYLGHEAWIIEHVIQARLRLLAAESLDERMRASAHLSEALSHLFQIAHGCVEFHRDDEAALVHLQVQLAEQKIALAREYYNHVVEHYNAYLEKFPQRLLARAGGFKRQDLVAFPLTTSGLYPSLD